MKKSISIILGSLNMFIGGVNILLHVLSQKITVFKFLKLDFEPNEDDIFIVTYPRSGTTLMQMIMYQLTSEGEMDFFHISEKVPFLERIPMTRIKSSEKRQRIYKTHLNYKEIPKGNGKYLHVIRNGKDVAVSYFHHYKNYQNYSGKFTEFLGRFLDGKLIYGSWFDFTKNWLENKDSLNIKVILYEDLVKDMRKTVSEIADFCEIKISDDKLNKVVENASFENMKLHEDKFDHANELLFDNGVTPNNFIRAGKSNSWKNVFTEDDLNRYQTEYKNQLEKYNLNYN